jgi:hypothetical protein
MTLMLLFGRALSGARSWKVSRFSEKDGHFRKSKEKEA